MEKEHLGVRVDADLKARIKELTTAGLYRDYSDFVERAIREKLAREGEEGRAAIRAEMVDALRTDPEVRAVLIEAIRNVTTV